ncbi:hypothetical protein, partial [Streptomyces sparsus]
MEARSPLCRPLANFHNAKEAFCYTEVNLEGRLSGVKGSGIPERATRGEGEAAQACGGTPRRRLRRLRRGVTVVTAATAVRTVASGAA